jgi:hypothetical protein
VDLKAYLGFSGTSFRLISRDSAPRLTICHAVTTGWLNFKFPRKKAKDRFFSFNGEQLTVECLMRDFRQEEWK